MDFAAIELRDRHDDRLDRVGIARGDALQSADNLRADEDRIDGQMRECRMPAFALDED